MFYLWFAHFPWSVFVHFPFTDPSVNSRIREAVGFIVPSTLWLGSRMVSVLNSGAEGPWFKSQPRRCRVTVVGKTVHTHRASVHKAAKLVAVLLRVARVTAGLAESNGSLPPGLWLTSPAGWLPRTGISSGTLRSVIEYGLPFLSTAAYNTIPSRGLVCDCWQLSLSRPRQQVSGYSACCSLSSSAPPMRFLREISPTMLLALSTTIRCRRPSVRNMTNVRYRENFSGTHGADWLTNGSCTRTSRQSNRT